MLPVAAALRLSVKTDELPATVTCPKCRHDTLQLFDDILTNGVWFHCINCRAAGDIVTFGAQIWNISLPEAADKFVELGLTAKTEVSRRLIEYGRAVDCQTAAGDFLLDVYAQIWNHNNDIIASRLREIGIRHETATDHDLVGVAHPDQLRNLCCALGRQRHSFLKTRAPSIIFPFFDLPGRLSGFLAVQYDADNKSQQTFIPVSRSRRGIINAGYYLLSTLYAPPVKPLNTNQFISDDVFWVTKMQTAALTQHGKLLPIAGTYSGPDADSLGAVVAANLPQNTTKIFHGVTLTPNIVSRACTARGYVSTAPVQQNLVNMQQLAQIKASAKTWRTALRKFFQAVRPETAESFTKRLTISAEKINAFLADNADVVAFDVVTSVTSTVENAQTVDTPKRTGRRVIERRTGWWSHTGRHISNVRPVITEILQLTDGSCFYRGYVHTETETYEFEEAAKTIETAGLLAYCRLLLAAQEKLVLFDAPWNAGSLNTALRLHPPKITRITNTYGWDEPTQTFRFCQYALDPAGNVQPHTTVKKAYDPLKDFEWPGIANPGKVHAFTTPTTDNIFTWLVSAVTLANLLAPVFRKPASSLALNPNQIEVAKILGRALGCAIEIIPPDTQKRQIVACWNELECGTWPQMFFGLFNADQLSGWAPSYFDRPIVAGVNTAATASLCSYGWYAIDAEPALTGNDYGALRELVPAYIQKVLQNRAEIIKTNKSFPQAILRDLHAWLAAVYGKTFNLELATTRLITPANAHTAIARELHAAIDDDKIAVLPLPRKRKQTQNYFLKTPECWWLNRWAIERHFKYAKSPPPNWIAFANLLSDHHAFLDEKIVNGNPGILVPANWFENCRRNTVLVKKETG